MDEIFYLMRRKPVDLLRYLPKFLSKSETFKGVEDTLSREHERYRLKIADIARQFFLETATWGLPDWERFLGIEPTAGQSYETRKSVARIKLRGAETMTPSNVVKLMTEFLTEGEAGIEELGDFELKLILDNGVFHWKELFQALLDYLPAHLDFSLKFQNEYNQNVYLGHPQIDVDIDKVQIADVSNKSQKIYIGGGSIDVDISTIPIAEISDKSQRNYIGMILAERISGYFIAEPVKIEPEKPEKPDKPDKPEPEPEPPDDEDDIFGRDFLRLYWKFPKNIYQSTLKNPRDENIGREIHFLEKYAREKRAVVDIYGNPLIRIEKALFIHRTKENIFGNDGGYIHKPKNDNGKFIRK